MTFIMMRRHYEVMQTNKPSVGIIRTRSLNTFFSLSRSFCFCYAGSQPMANSSPIIPSRRRPRFNARKVSLIHLQIESAVSASTMS